MRVDEITLLVAVLALAALQFQLDQVGMVDEVKIPLVDA